MLATSATNGHGHERHAPKNVDRPREPAHTAGSDVQSSARLKSRGYDGLIEPHAGRCLGTRARVKDIEGPRGSCGQESGL